MADAVIQMAITKPEDVAKRVSESVDEVDAGTIFARVLVDLTRQHIQKRYPNSKHWDPEKVVPIVVDRNSGGCRIDIAGADRAYHDINIYPKKGTYLAIPMAQYAMGKSPTEFSGLFKPRNSSILAQKANDGSLVALFALTQHVYQPKDDTLLPTEQEYADAAAEAWTEGYVETLKYNA